MAKIEKQRADQILEMILRIAEKGYGPQIPDFRIRGVKFEPGIEIPQIRIEGKDVIVLIDEKNRTECDRLCYQLAHEAIHLLSPVSRAEVSVLEEGLATHFAALFMRTSFRVVSGCPNSKRCWDESGEEKFERAHALYRELDGFDSQAVMKLREIQPIISQLTPTSILSLFAKLSQHTVGELCKSFEHWVHAQQG